MPDSQIGWMLEETLDVPSECHELMNEFPLAPQTTKICYDDLSPYCKKLVKKNYESTKLVGDFRRKENYVLSYQTLQFYLKHGLKLVDVHRVVQFKQAPIARQMIELTTSLRGKATSAVQIAFLKFFNNILYGK